MFFKNCGKEIPNDSKFCQFCGTPLDTTVAVSQTPAPHKFNDLLEIVAELELWSNRRNQISAIKKFIDIRHCSTNEGMQLYRDVMADTQFLEQAKELKASWDSDLTTCPKCHKAHVHIDKQGYSLKKGIIGDILLGPVGLIAGKHKSNNIRFTCLDCGYQWTKK